MKIPEEDVQDWLRDYTPLPHDEPLFACHVCLYSNWGFSSDNCFCTYWRFLPSNSQEDCPWIADIKRWPETRYTYDRSAKAQKLLLTKSK